MQRFFATLRMTGLSFPFASNVSRLQPIAMKPYPLILGVLFLAAPVFAAPNPDAPPPGATDKEIEMGRKAAEEFEKNPKVKMLDAKDAANKALLDKLNKMAETLGKASSRPDIKYTVKVIDDKDINAFTLPNGQIYFYKGLIDFTNNDDELAAVLAHEIGHNARLHALRGEAKARKLSWAGVAAMLMALGGGRAGMDVMQFSQYLLIGIMNGYGEEYEKEADQAAIGEMVKTPYNPSALVTFMQRLNLEEKAHPEVELGIFRTHPPSDERAGAAKAEMQKIGVPFTPRDVSGGRLAKASEGDGRFAVKRGDVTLFEIAFSDKDKSAAQQRANAAADQVNELMRSGLMAHEIHAEATSDGARLVARGQEIVRVTGADAALQKLAPLDCAQKWRTNLSRLFWKETLGGKS